MIGARGEIAIERERAGRIVIARESDRRCRPDRNWNPGWPSPECRACALRRPRSASLLVSITNSMFGRPPISLMPPSERSSLSRSRNRPSNSFFLRPELCAEFSVSSIAAHALDRVRDRLPVGQRAAEPAVVHVILRAALRRRGDRLRRLPLRADEQDAAAARRRIAQGDQRLVQQRHGLGQVDDVDVVARAVDVRRHLGVPALGAMAEMGAASRSWRMVNSGNAIRERLLLRLA